MPTFRKKPVVVKAVRLKEGIVIHTLEGDMTGDAGDWLITGINGEKYPCKHDIFVKTYDPEGMEATAYFYEVGGEE